jgi:hypothetical protein
MSSAWRRLRGKYVRVCLNHPPEERCSGDLTPAMPFLLIAADGATYDEGGSGWSVGIVVPKGRGGR